jgi:hypothetical protein
MILVYVQTSYFSITDAGTSQMLQDEFPLHPWIARYKSAAPMVLK